MVQAPDDLDAIRHPLREAADRRDRSLESPLGRFSVARSFYETEALRGGWTVRRPQRQVDSQFYERTALSRNKVAMLEKGGLEKPGDAVTADEEVKDPFVLEFLVRSARVALRHERPRKGLENHVLQCAYRPRATEKPQDRSTGSAASSFRGIQRALRPEEPDSARDSIGSRRAGSSHSDHATSVKAIDISWVETSLAKASDARARRATVPLAKNERMRQRGLRRRWVHARALQRSEDAVERSARHRAWSAGGARKQKRDLVELDRDRRQRRSPSIGGRPTRSPSSVCRSRPSESGAGSRPRGRYRARG